MKPIGTLEHCLEMSIEVDIISYTPERPAPPCNNPDSPRFSDSGDAEECEYEAFFRYMDGKDMKRVPMPSELYNRYHCLIMEQIRQYLEVEDEIKKLK